MYRNQYMVTDDRECSLNFNIAQIEITALQNLIAGGPFLPLKGGTMTGFLTRCVAILASNFDVATKQYVDNCL